MCLSALKMCRDGIEICKDEFSHYCASLLPWERHKE